MYNPRSIEHKTWASIDYQFQTTLILLEIAFLTSDVVRSIKKLTAIYCNACIFLDLDGLEHNSNGIPVN